LTPPPGAVVTAAAPAEDRPGLVGCPICGLAQTVAALPAGTRAHCARCDAVLRRRGWTEPTHAAFCFALSALLLFIPANLYPVLDVSTFGRSHSYTVLSGAKALWAGTMWPLAIPVVLASVVLPAALILVLLALAATRVLQAGVGIARLLHRLCEALRTWAIVDVYVLAIFITVVKLAQMTRAEPALGAGLFFAMALCLTLALRSLDARGPGLDPASRPPDPASLGRTVALALTALILFVPANLYPTLTVSARGTTETATVFGGVLDLWQAGMWPLSLIVLCASLLIPFFKIVGLMFLSLTIDRTTNRRARTRLYVLIAQIGRWSMLDVYVISLIVAVLHFGPLAEAHADIGSIVFASVVIVTLMAARSFDPRLIWQTAPARREGE
jgi:paraquat-inducible protein A